MTNVEGYSILNERQPTPALKGREAMPLVANDLIDETKLENPSTDEATQVDDVLRHYEDAVDLYKRGLLYDAVLQLRIAFALDPGFADVRSRLKDYEQQLEDAMTDVTDFDDLVKHDPQNAELRVDLAKSLCAIGHCDNAKFHLVEAMRMPDKYWANQAKKVLERIS